MTSIAILVPSADISTTAFINAFRTELHTLNNDDYHCTIYHDDGVHRLKDALQENQHETLITYGALCTETARKIVQEIKSPIIIICASIIAAIPNKNEKLVSISTSLEGYIHNLRIIFPFMPMVRKALIFYDEDNPVMVSLQKKLTSLLRERADEKEVVTAYPLHSPLIRRDIMLIADHHIVIVLTQHPRTTEIQRLARLCVEHKTVLYINETNATGHGAALGMGLSDIEIGKAAAQLAYKTLDKEQKTIPESVILNSQLRINAAALAQQGLPMMRVAPLLSLIEATTMVNPTPQAKVAAYLRMEHIPLE